MFLQYLKGMGNMKLTKEQILRVRDMTLEEI